MQNDTTQFLQPIQVALTSTDEIHQLRQEIDILTNKLAFALELMQQLRDENAVLKGQKPKPKFPPSKLESKQNNSDQSNSSDPNNPSPSKKQPKPGQPKGKKRKKKKTILEIHNEVVLQPASIPEGAVFKGYRPYSVQDIIIKTNNTRYLRARYKLPDGSYVEGELPPDIHGHYGPEIITYIFDQYHSCRVTEPLLLAQLHARGILISSGQLNNILIQNNALYEQEVNELLVAGVKAANQIQVDDTGGRHDGDNQYTTIIGNQWFSVFTTTDSKSRINFLKLLQGNKEHYLINEDTIAYLAQCKVSGYLQGYIAMHQGGKYATLAAWEQFIKELNITQANDVRFLTEAALFASLFEHGIPRDLLIHSDDAGQFDVILFINTLCWIHEERHYRKLIMTTDEARVDLERVKGQIWTFYQMLKAYKTNPNQQVIAVIEKQFDDIFQQKTSSLTLDHQLKKTHGKKKELLGVLKRPDSPLHNNRSETDARAAKIKLKVSGGTRSDVGRASRDIFLSLKQTCLKLGLNFITFLRDRVRGLYNIPKLAEIIRQRSSIAASDPPSIGLPLESVLLAMAS
jgi:Transposase IS66 family